MMNFATTIRHECIAGEINVHNSDNDLVILLGGGVKKRQRNDIAAARDFWTDHKARKRRET